jgi:RNA polymerase sigma-70 factor (ECF subfamily)
VNGAALDRVFRAASGRIIAALAARFRDVTLAEDAFSEACLRAMRTWPERGMPADPAAWLYRAAERAFLDALRRKQVRERHAPDVPPEPTAEDVMSDDSYIIPDERLRLIFICCHPAVAPEARVALTLRLVCGLTITEIARAFLVQEAALSQRLLRAKRKIADAGVPFELPLPQFWPERMEAVLSTLEIAYAKAHEDAGGTGAHAGFAAEMLHLTRLLTELAPDVGGAFAVAALVRFAEARRPARVDGEGVMIPLSEQDPALWRRDMISDAGLFLRRAMQLTPQNPRTLQALLQQTWCMRQSRNDPAPWPEILRLYDELLTLRDDVVVRLNRVVALAEVEGPAAALSELEELDAPGLDEFLSYHAVRADFLSRVGRTEEGKTAYDRALALEPSSAERRWLERKASELTN